MGIDDIDGSLVVVARQNPEVDGELVVGGAAPVEATQVRITAAGNSPVIVDTVAFAGTPEARFFRANVLGGAGSVSIAWLAVDDTVAAGHVERSVIACVAFVSLSDYGGAGDDQYRNQTWNGP